MKNRKITLIYLFSVVIIILAIIVLFVKKEEKKQLLSQLPEFSFKETDGYINSSRNLPQSENYIIILFNSDCEGCKVEAEFISDNIELMKENCFLFLSPESIPGIEHFMIKYQLNNQENVYFGNVSIDTINIKLGTSTIPWSFIYDRNKRLLKSGLALTRVDMEKYLIK